MPAAQSSLALRIFTPSPPSALPLQRELRQLQLRLGQLQSSSAASLGSTGKPQGAAGGAASSGGGGGEQQHQQQVAASGSSGAGSAPDTTAAAAAISSLPLDLSQLAFPLRPVGVLRSCFSRRNGTPRQPLLVPAARARLTLRTGLSAEFFDGLQQYRWVWSSTCVTGSCRRRGGWRVGSSSHRFEAL